MSFSIAGKTAVVTGAANGVGLSIARQFVKNGANVMFADMDEARLAEEVGENDDTDGTAAYYAGDLREKLTIANLLSATIDRFERVDILVNASRQMVASDPLNPDDDAVPMLIEQNLMTSLRVTQVFARRMIKQAGGDSDTPAAAASSRAPAPPTRSTRWQSYGESIPRWHSVSSWGWVSLPPSTSGTSGGGFSISRICAWRSAGMRARRSAPSWRR